MTKYLKICGISKMADAKFCITQKVNFLGFIFYEKSPRKISINNASLILDEIGGKIKTVAVTKDPSNDLLNSLASLKFEYIQVHGNISIDRLTEIKSITNKKIIMAFNVSSESDLEKIENYENLSEFLLFDSASPGSGKQFDWSLINNVVTKKDFFLSGGLNSENLLSAINSVKTNYFDISSGVEKISGVKDITKISEVVNIINSKH